nr:MAG TPA: BppU domain protein [Caudoviricetes sp.]
MHNITIDFNNPGLPQVIDVMQSDAQSRFIGLTLYDGGVPYSAPSGAVYTVEYHGQGANNTGWYDTIQLPSGTRKAVVVSSSSPNVVTLELAEQALRVNGKVEVSLCVVNNTGYKLNTFPIICRVTGAPYVDPVSVRSYFYVTGLTSEQWTAYVNACQDAQKRAEDAAAKLVIDKTLTQEGQAADAKATGDAIGEIKENFNGLQIKNLSWVPGILYYDDTNKIYVEHSQKNGVTSNYIKIYKDEIIRYVPTILFGLNAWCIVATFDKNKKQIKRYDELKNSRDRIIIQNDGYIRLSFGVPNGAYTMTPYLANENFKAYILNSGNRFTAESYIPSIENNSFVDGIGFRPKAMDGKGNYTTEKYKSSYVVVDEYSGEKVTLEKGAKYRVYINIAYNIFIYWGNKKRVLSDTQMFDFVADSDKLSMQIQRFDAGDFTGDPEVYACGLVIYKINRKNTSVLYDYIVAPYNASDEDKAKADLICDGENDEVEINCAVNGCVTEKTSCNVLLLGGTYNIGTSHAYFPSNLDAANYSKEKALMYRSAICIQRNWLGDGYHEGMNSTVIHGVSIPYSGNDISSAKIRLDAEAINKFNNDYEHCVFSFSKYGADYLGWMDWKNIVQYKNLLFDFDNTTKSIIAIDAVSSSGLMVENCVINGNRKLRETGSFYLDTVPIKEKCIGIRGDCGGDNGMGYSYIKSCTVIGMYEGIAITGEHFVIENCLQHSCHYGFTIGNYPTQPKMEHPITFIGNSVEQCYRMALLNRYGATEEKKDELYEHDGQQTIVYIGGSVETSWANSKGGRTEMLPIKEIIKGAYRGRFESDWGGTPHYKSIFEEGSGINIEQILHGWVK